MRKLALPLSLAAIAVLGACSTMDPATPAPAPVVVAPAPSQVVVAPAPGTVLAPGTVVAASPSTATVVAPTALMTGFGRVESIMPLANAAAGSSGRSTRRMGLRMDNGTVQYIDTPADLAIGDRVEITTDGYIRRP
jgi:hypothetical protein